jgi:predicted MPP superfamily phosphohydrolase
MIETKDFFPKPKTIDISINKLPQKLEGLKILHLSDLHINKKTTIKMIDRLISTANSLEPNIIVITGDIIDVKASTIEDKLQLFKLLRADTYFISGNHDLMYGLDDLVDILSDWHINFIDNQFLQIEHNGESFYIAGLSDRFSKFFGYKRDVDKFIDQMREIEPLIFLAHQPKDYKIAQKSGASLFLAGHTHGGQIFPFHFLVKLVQPFLAGLHFKDNMSIYINRGFGNWGVNMRFLAPSEITLLKLKGAT